MSALVISKEQFIEKIRRWVLLDNQLKIIHEKTKTLREEKQALNKEILPLFRNK